jgi:hypothetical protein
VDAQDGYFDLRSDDIRTNIRFSDWPGVLRDESAVLAIGDNVIAFGWLGATSLTSGGALDVVGVYVEDRKTYFTLSQAIDTIDDSDAPILPPSGGFGPVDNSASLTGVISEIAEGNLILRAGEVDVPVQMSSLSHNPYDDIGSQVLKIGDTIMINGPLTRNSSGEFGLRATRVTRISVVEAAR